MPYLDSLPADATLRDVFAAFPDTSHPLRAFHDALLRGPSPFTEGERELIAAYVSGLNACVYCHGVHTATAETYGIAEGVLTHLLDDLDGAPVDDRMKPILAYVRKLTLTPSRMTPTDAATVFAAGWTEKALHDAVSVCALFNFMNRYVEGLGITAGPDYFKEAAARLHAHGYGGD